MEPLDFENVVKERRRSLAQTIRTITVPEMKKLGEELFKSGDDPWRDTYFGFITENPGATYHHAVTSDSIQILYCKDKDKGLWFVASGGKGPLQTHGRRVMKELIEGSR
jgi:hypothetical protein